MTSEWCTAINNLSFLKQYLDKMEEKLRIPEDSISKSKEYNKILKKLTENIRNILKEKSMEYINVIMKQVIDPEMNRLFVISVKSCDNEVELFDDFAKFVVDNLTILYNQLSEENIEKIFEIFWGNLIKLIESKRRILKVIFDNIRFF